MGIDAAVRQIDREIRTATEALSAAKRRSARASAALRRASADEAAKRKQVDRLVEAKRLLTNEAEPKRRSAGRPAGEDRKLYERFVAAVEHMERGTTRAQLRAALDISQTTMEKYLRRAVREGRVTVSDTTRRGSPILVRNEQVIDISLRRSA